MQVGRPGAVPPTLGCLLGLPWTNPGQYLQSLLAYSDFLQIKKEREIKTNHINYYTDICEREEVL